MSKDYVGGGIELGDIVKESYKSIIESVVNEVLGEHAMAWGTIELLFAQWHIDNQRYRSRHNKHIKECQILGTYLGRKPLTICHLFVIKGTDVYEAYGVARLKPGDEWSEKGGRAPAYGRAMCKIAQQMDGPKYPSIIRIGPGTLHFGIAP